MLRFIFKMLNVIIDIEHIFTQLGKVTQLEKKIRELKTDIQQTL